jgi:lipoprotein-releasing system permease protein
VRTSAILVLLATAACNSKSVLPDKAAVPIPAWAHDRPDVLRDKINGVNAHVIVLKSSAPFTEYRDVLATAEKTRGVVKAEPFQFLEGTIARGSGSPLEVKLKGVDPARVDGVLTIGKHMTAGTLASLTAGDPPPIVLGDGLATKLGTKPGDDVTVTLPADNQPPDVEPVDHLPARTKVFRLTGTFHMDFDQYDDGMAVASLPATQALVGRGDQVMGVEMTVSDVDEAGTVAKAIGDALGGMPYVAMDWYELNKPLYTAMYGDKRPSR